MSSFLAAEAKQISDGVKIGIYDTGTNLPMSIILGINAYHPDSSAALLVDGKPIAAIAEERLNRIKHYAGFPHLAVNACLQVAGLTWKDVDVLSIGSDPLANRFRKAMYSLGHPRLITNFNKILQRKNSINDLHNLISANCNEPLENLRFKVMPVEHHLAHIASAYFASPWENAAGISVDGSGDFVTCMMSYCQGSDIFVKKKVFIPYSLGNLYTAICQFIGYDNYGDEGKVMGLAPLGENTYAKFMQKIVQITDRGFTANLDYLSRFGTNQGFVIQNDGSVNLQPQYSNKMIEELGPPRQRNSEITQRDMDLAYSLQHRFEEIYLHLIKSLADLTPEKQVAIAGGCALNSVANGKIFRATPFTETCIQPAAGDDGLALGSALYASNSILKEDKRWVMENAYLGPEFSDLEIESELNRMGIFYKKLNREKLLSETVSQLALGNVVGWFQGRMEWGPRALGNRSILAHPGLPTIKDTLNARIKHRESFRPFAPVVLVEKQNEIFDYHHPSPFMLHVYGIRPNWRDRLCAVNHVDNTGRLQTVSRDENPLYYDLIDKFFEKTGVPVLLNTSFNENEPIVCTPTEAIACFQRTKMDVLAIGSFLCRKSLSPERNIS